MAYWKRGDDMLKKMFALSDKGAKSLKGGILATRGYFELVLLSSPILYALC